MIQLEFWEETESQKLSKKCDLLERRIDKMRKSQFALISEIKKLANENKHDLEMLKSNICKNKLNFWD
jgi:hypothetical protein